MSFKKFISHPGLLKALENAGLTQPTPIQEKAIPEVLSGKDLRASAQTGTGKTIAFLLPALHLLTTAQSGKGPRILILVPTRELAMQVAEEALKYSAFLEKVKTVCIYGGTPYPPQYKQLSRPYEILVATPGRLIDHLERGKIHLSRIEMLILDEADRMLDMGFLEAVELIAKATPKTRQTLMFSATLPKNVRILSERLLRQPLELSIAPDHTKKANIEEQLYRVDNLEHKYKLLDQLLRDGELKQAIVFAATKRQVDQLAHKLAQQGHRAVGLHGDMNQRQRSRAVMQLRKGEINILVATDVAGRGIDVPLISHVINFDLPKNAEDYVHRIGRTGRAGANGIAWSLVSPRDKNFIREIEKYSGKKIRYNK